ncbi:MAG: DNA methyltransferase [Desulfitobacterium hafniense]|nr:DNA methyltransferase [Desulfitobacterium hafniense]
MKLTKEQIDKVRNIEGFPIAKDEDIIALSEPPYYTACPNPFIEDFIKEHGKPYDEATDTYHREPFAADVSEGKSDPIYNAHSYHTKVPYKAIMRYILHFTEPGDIIYDGFCGTGMTGVAAQMCDEPDPDFKYKLEREMPYIKWGARKAILNDLSPAATFIAANYNSPVNTLAFEEEAKKVLAECENELSWMYETRHTMQNAGKQMELVDKPVMGMINCIVWSDLLICPNCSKEIVFWEAGIDREKEVAYDVFRCKHCDKELKKTYCERAQETKYDQGLNEIVTMAKQVPVLIIYSIGKKRFEKSPDQYDLELIHRIEEMEMPFWYPTDRMPDGYNTEQPKRSHGIAHVQQFYTKRNLIVLSFLKERIQNLRLGFEFTSLISRSSKQLRLLISNFFNGKGGWVGTGLSGTLYIPSLGIEVNPIWTFKNKINKAIMFKYAKKGNTLVSCQSATNVINIHSNTVDYIFTDPPFGSNLNYSELSFIWESWLKNITNNKTEAIVNTSQKKGLLEYQHLMEQCFCEYYRVLKPGRWMTVEFHNSQNAVWNAIQESLLRAGFVVADVRTLDKKQGSFKQVTTTSAVKQDLVISAYKPKESFKRRFLEHAGSMDAVWDFVRQHLEQLPKVVVNKGKIEVIAERQSFLLFDRMVAFHIMNGIPVPIDAPDFYKGLKERFIERDGMFFLADQVNEYDEKRLKMDVEHIQMSLIVTDEKSAIAWLYAELETPQTRQELQPKFMQELHKVKYEAMPELDIILADNFLQDDEGKWYIADLNKQSDLDKIRNKRLIKDFEEYLKGTGKLKVFRSEAVRAGFDNAWKKRDFVTIVKVGKRLPEEIIQEDPALLMYYDNALSRME